MQHGEAIYKTGSELVFQGRLKDYQYSLLLGELIDNSRDAKSTEVRVLVRQVKAKGFRVWGLTVRDNGVGTDEDGVRKVFIPGKASHRSIGNHQTIGGYGCGGKLAHHAFAYDRHSKNTSARFTTVNENGERLEATQPYGQIMHNDEIVRVPQVSKGSPDADREFETGSILYIEGASAIKGLFDELVKVNEDLSEIYRPAICSGFSLIVNDQKLKSKPIDFIGDPIILAGCLEDDGLEYHFEVVCGEVSGGRKPTFDFVFLGRVITYWDDPYGFGLDLPLSGFYGEVRLGKITRCGEEDNTKMWPLGATKDSIDREVKKKIGDSVRGCPEIIAMLSRLNESSEEQVYELQENKDNEFIDQILGTRDGVKERRDPGQGGTGTVEPAGTGRKRIPKKVQPGSSVGQGENQTPKKKTFRVRYQKGNGVTPAIVPDYEAGTLTIATDFPGVAAWLKDSKMRGLEGMNGWNRANFYTTFWAACEPDTITSTRESARVRREKLVNQFEANLRRLAQ